MSSLSPNWPYVTAGIPDEWFDRLPGIPLTKRETRLIILSMLRLRPNSVLWDVGAGTGTIPVEVGLLCPQGQVVAIERDPDVTPLIRANCDRFGVANVRVIEGNAPECLADLPDNPDRVCLESGRTGQALLQAIWPRLPQGGRVVATANSLETLYTFSAGLAQVQARNIEVVQSNINRLETRGTSQVFAAVNPIFILSGDKLE